MLAHNTLSEPMYSDLTVIRLGNRLQSLLEENGPRHSVNFVLDELLSFNFALTRANFEALFTALKKIVKYISADDTCLVAKSAQLITRVLSQHTSPVKGRLVEDGIVWCTKALWKFQSLNVVAVLSAMEFFLRGNAHLIPNREGLFGEYGIFLVFLQSTLYQQSSMYFLSSSEVHIMIFKCVEAILMTPAENLSVFFVEKICYICQYLLNTLYNSSEDINQCQVAYEALKVLRKIFAKLETKDHSQTLGDMLGIIKCYMFFGLPLNGNEPPQHVYSTVLPLGHETFFSGNAECSTKPIRVRKTKTNWHSSPAEDNGGSKGALKFEKCSSYGIENSYSGDEFQPSDFEPGHSRLNREQSKVRTEALALLSVIIKETESKVMFGFWQSLLPDGPIPMCPRNIINILKYDTHEGVRMEAINVLINMLCGSKTYLSQAEVSMKTSGSFRPLSSLLGDMVMELHASLSHALMNESSPQVIVHLLRCIAKLVQNTTYSRLPQGLLTKLIVLVNKYMSHKVYTVQVASLTVIGCVISITPAMDEINHILKEPQERIQNLKVEDEQLVDGRNYQKICKCVEEKHDCIENCGCNIPVSCFPWILEICFKNLGIDEALQKAIDMLPVTVRVESFQVLSCLAKAYKSFVPNYLKWFLEIILIGVNDSDENVVLHAGKCIEAVGIAYNQLADEDEDDFLKPGVLFWESMLHSAIEKLLSHKQPIVIAAGYQCLTAIGRHIFENLDPLNHYFIASKLMQSEISRDPIVTAAVVTAIGTYIQFSPIQNVPRYVIDFSFFILSNVDSPATPVRISAAWSLGNLSEVVADLKNIRKQCLNSNYVKVMLDGCISSSSAVEKVQPGMVRAMGNFVGVADKIMVEKSLIKGTLVTAIGLLTQYATRGKNMKVRWNACYSLGKVMNNDALYIQGYMDWQHLVFPILMDIVKNGIHFKVRIGAAAALRAPDTQWKYGQYYGDVWETLVQGLENSQYTSNFDEYQHQEQLRDEMCCTICHLSRLLVRADFGKMKEILAGHKDSLAAHFKKFKDHIPPEKGNIFLSAVEHLYSVVGCATPNSQDKVKCARLILEILSPVLP